MASLTFTNFDEMLVFLQNPANDGWNPYMTANSCTLTFEKDGRTMKGVPAARYQDLKMVLDARRNRVGADTCVLF